MKNKRTVIKTPFPTLGCVAKKFTIPKLTQKRIRTAVREVIESDLVKGLSRMTEQELSAFQGRLKYYRKNYSSPTKIANSLLRLTHKAGKLKKQRKKKN